MWKAQVAVDLDCQPSSARNKGRSKKATKAWILNIVFVFSASASRAPAYLAGSLVNGENLVRVEGNRHQPWTADSQSFEAHTREAARA